MVGIAALTTSIGVSMKLARDLRLITQGSDVVTYLFDPIPGYCKTACDHASIVAAAGVAGESERHKRFAG
ncbi:MAG: hypothetical protein WBF53_11760 [Litorimonas sp.]